MAVYGLGGLIGIAIIPLAMILAVTCPAVVSRWRLRGRSLRTEPRAEARPAPTVDCPPERAPALHELTDQELCAAWRRSFVELQRADSLEVKAAIAGLRQRVLDELERRDLAGFDDWLVSGAHAASDPARYLIDRDGQRRPQ